VLFGGDRLDQLTCDTWTFDVATNKWEEKTPARSPSPRGGHALLWLPEAKKVLLIGGYGYKSAEGYVEAPYRNLPADAWTYDTAANRWDVVALVDAKGGPQTVSNVFVSAAVTDNDEVLLLDAKRTAWLLKVDAARSD